jgi:ABC-type histidine transport system ATPase subunit
MSSPTKAEPPMIRMTGVNKHFGSLHVLRDINLEVARGEVVVVLAAYSHRRKLLTCGFATPRRSPALCMPPGPSAKRP